MAKTKSKQAGPDIKAFFEYLNDIALDKGLSREDLLEVVRSSLITAYQKKYGPETRLEVILDRDKPEISVIIKRIVVPAVDNLALQISLEDAIKVKEDASIGDEILQKEFPFDFSRIGATNVRQILLQRLKELEREIVYNEFKGKEGELINGTFLRWRDRNIMYVDLGRIEGVLPPREQIPNEKFRPGDRIKAVIKSVELSREKSREPGPFITLSRASGEFVKRLFEMEIPEIYDNVVEILAVARDAGFRTKILVRSNRSDVDAVGACVGIKGVRIQSIVRELGTERIDIVEYDEDITVLIKKALLPAEVVEVRIDGTNKEALVVVKDDSYSQAIGTSGKNVRLASQLTGFRLLVRPYSKYEEEMSSPEARAEYERIFQNPQSVSYQGAEEEEESTPISELPNISPRVITILESAGIQSVEQLVEYDLERLSLVPGLGKTTARQILQVISEVVSYAEE